MDFRVLGTVFAAIFIAELGDKTQLATLLFAADNNVSRLTVFLGASLALILTTAIGVTVGGALAQLISERHLRFVAGTGFIVIGLWTILKG